MTTDITTIEKDLRELWNENAAGAGGQAVTRALTLNLLACARDAEIADTISSVARQLTAGHPNRTVLVIERPDQPGPALDAWVQANCLLTAPGVPQVCGEQITIDARGQSSAQATSLVLPLLVADLPVVLWMPGPAPLASPIFARLRPVIDRLIVDSTSFSNPLADLISLADFERTPLPGPGNGAESPAVGDLNWTRLTAWRELTAQFFDTRPLLPHLHRLDEVEIAYAAEGVPGGQIEALLLAGWLAASLGWQLDPGGATQQFDQIRLQFTRSAVGTAAGQTRPVTVVLRPGAETDRKLTAIRALKLRATDNVLAEFSVERGDDPTCVHTMARVDGHPPISRMAHLEQSDLASLLAAELRLLSRDRTYSSALQLAASCARLLS